LVLVNAVFIINNAGVNYQFLLAKAMFVIQVVTLSLCASVIGNHHVGINVLVLISGSIPEQRQRRAEGGHFSTAAGRDTEVSEGCLCALK
jgi:hypothetical protein